MLSPEAKAYLLGVARDTLRVHVAKQPVALRAEPEAVAAQVRALRGAFVTLRGPGGELRGSVGSFAFDQALVDMVRKMTLAAASEDQRFAPLMAAEVAKVAVEISALSPPEPVQPEGVVVGRHGLLVSKGRSRGVLLPQAAIEWDWTREEFLSHACIKAELLPDAWRDGSAQLFAFEADVFGEEEPLTAA